MIYLAFLKPYLCQVHRLHLYQNACAKALCIDKISIFSAVQHISLTDLLLVGYMPGKKIYTRTELNLSSYPRRLNTLVTFNDYCK